MAVISKEDSSANEFPSGWRFMPTEQELIESYLSRKEANIIQEIDAHDFYQHHPKYLVDNVCFKTEPIPRSLNLQYWYLFINHDDYFHGRITKMKQVGEGNVGFWRSDGKEEEVEDEHGNVLAYKIHSTFFSSKSKKTNWKMEVYRLSNNHHDHENPPSDEWVVARIRGAQSLNQTQH